jgi:putative restriction endonuclease
LPDTGEARSEGGVAIAKYFGTPPGVHVGQQFLSRQELHDVGLHAPIQGGISGTKLEGADSIVVSGGYGDDRDYGEYILYTGHGGRDPSSGKQVADQSVDAPGNAGMVTSLTLGLPVRVIRGAHKGSPFAPPAGYRYAGLFLVTDLKIRDGADGFKVLQFRLDRLGEQDPYISGGESAPDPAFATTTISRRIRDSGVARQVKRLYDYTCQACGTSILNFQGRPYAEGAHVRPLGRPHLGADSMFNLLCLCPNHHTKLDLGGATISDEMVLSSVDKAEVFELQFKKDHVLGVENAAYHRSMWPLAG